LSLEYESRKLEARFSEVSEAFEALKTAVETCSKALAEVASGSRSWREVLPAISALLEALGRFEHELSHLAESASSIISALTKLEQ